MTPLARVRHRAAGEHDDRAERERSRRYEEDRAAARVGAEERRVRQPRCGSCRSALALTVFRLVYLTLSRRFEEAYDLLAARRVEPRAPAGDAVAPPARSSRAAACGSHLRRFTESAGLRLPRWFQTAERIWRSSASGARTRARSRRRAGWATGRSRSSRRTRSSSGASSRRSWGRSRCGASSVPARSSAPRSRRSRPSPTGFLAGARLRVPDDAARRRAAASPALGAMSGLSFLTFGSTAMAQKVMLVGGPVLAGVLCYRACARLTGRPGPAMVAASAYALSALTLSSFSRRPDRAARGDRGDAGHRRAPRGGVRRADPPDGRWRFVAGFGVTLAVASRSCPGCSWRSRSSRWCTCSWAAGGAAASASWRWRSWAAPSCCSPSCRPWPAAAAGPWRRRSAPSTLVRPSPGDRRGPGTWAPAFFLPWPPSSGWRSRAGRGVPGAPRGVGASVALPLAWLSTAGYLPAPLANAPVVPRRGRRAGGLLVALGSRRPASVWNASPSGSVRSARC